MRSIQASCAVYSIAIIAILAACTTTTIVEPLPEPEPELEELPAPPVDWTGKTCESPAYAGILGSYRGQLTYRGDYSRECRWETEIEILGESTDHECSLSGSVTALISEQDAEDHNATYACGIVREKARFVVGLAHPDLNVSVPSSVIVHLNDDMQPIDPLGKKIVNPVGQFESLTAQDGMLISDGGSVLYRQFRQFEPL